MLNNGNLIPFVTEGDMTDNNMICIKRGNISYCWNMATNQVEIYTRKTGEIGDCPKDVASEMVTILSEKLKGKE